MESCWQLQSQKFMQDRNFSIVDSYFSLVSLSLANLKDRNLPKYCASATAASFPDGRSRPQSRSMMSISSSTLRLADVPSIQDACCRMVILCSLTRIPKVLHIVMTVQAVMILVKLAISLLSLSFRSDSTSWSSAVIAIQAAADMVGRGSLSAFRVLETSPEKLEMKCCSFGSSSQLCQQRFLLLGLSLLRSILTRLSGLIESTGDDGFLLEQTVLQPPAVEFLFMLLKSSLFLVGEAASKVCLRRMVSMGSIFLGEKSASLVRMMTLWARCLGSMCADCAVLRLRRQEANLALSGSQSSLFSRADSQTSGSSSTKLSSYTQFIFRIYNIIAIHPLLLTFPSI